MKNLVRNIGILSLLMIISFTLAGCQSDNEKVLISNTSIYNNKEDVYTYSYEDDLLVEMYLNDELYETYEYDEEGNVIKIVRAEDIITREYQNGNVIKTKRILNDGTVYTGEYEYNSDNQIIKFISKVDDNIIGESEYTYSDLENILKSTYENGTVEETRSTLDEAGNAILKVIYIDGEESQVVESKYNSDNFLIESIVTFSDNGEKIINTYEYDKDNNMLAAYEQINDGERKLVDSYVYE